MSPTLSTSIVMQLPRALGRLHRQGHRATAAEASSVQPRAWVSVRASPRRHCRAATTRASAGAAARGPAAAAFKARLRAGSPLFGIFLNSASPLVAEQLAMLDYDYLLVGGPQELGAGRSDLPCGRWV